MARVLVVDADADVRLLLARALRTSGHEAVVASGARSGLELARSGGAQLIVLDMLLPDLAGPSALAALKADARTASIPVIALSTRAGEAERIAGLEAGADDFVAKPFSPRELMLRVGVALRRSSAPPLEARPQVSVSGPVRLELDAHRAFVEGRELPLTPTEYKLLHTLVERTERVLSREVLLADVWGMVPDVETRTVDVHVKRLREKLGPAAGWVETVRGVGYRFRRPP